MIGNHAHLVVAELVALGDQLHHMKHRLRRNMHGEPVAVETRHRGMRLEAGVLLRAGAEGALDQQRIVRRARAVDPAPHLLRLLGERRRRSADIAFPGRRRTAAFGDVAGLLARGFFEHHRRIGLARFVEPDRRRQAFAAELDGGDGGQRGLAIAGRDGGDRFADIADDAVVAEQRDHSTHARHRARRRQIEFADARMRERRAQDHAFELAVMMDVDGILRRSRHLVARFHARRQDVVAVEAAGAGIRHGAEDAVIGAAAAQMSRQRRADFLARRHRRSLCRAPGIVKRRGLDDEARRAEAALQGVVRHEGLLHRVQPCGADAFDRRHVRVRGRARRHQAAHGGLAVDQHGAGAADAGPADQLGAGEVERVAHDVDQQRIGIVGEGSELAVDRHRAHLRSPDLREVDRGTAFFAGFGVAARGFAAGRTAPATSVRSMISRSFRKASAGCIAG